MICLLKTMEELTRMVGNLRKYDMNNGDNQGGNDDVGTFDNSLHLTSQSSSEDSGSVEGDTSGYSSTVSGSSEGSTENATMEELSSEVFLVTDKNGQISLQSGGDCSKNSEVQIFLENSASSKNIDENSASEKSNQACVSSLEATRNTNPTCMSDSESCKNNSFTNSIETSNIACTEDLINDKSFTNETTTDDRDNQQYKLILSSDASNCKQNCKVNVEGSENRCIINTEYTSGENGAGVRHRLKLPRWGNCIILKVNDVPTAGLTFELFKAFLLPEQGKKHSVQLLVRSAAKNHVQYCMVRVQITSHDHKNQSITIMEKLDVMAHNHCRQEAKVALCNNESCLRCEVKVVQCEIEIDYYLEMVHTVVKELCYVQHVKSQMYLKITEQELIISELQNHDQTSVLQKSQTGAVPQGIPDQSAKVLFLFKETYPDSTAYICGKSESAIEMKRLPTIPDSATVLNSFDPRLFFHTQESSEIAHQFVSCFESTCYEGCYLAVGTDNKVKLKKVTKEKVTSDPEIQFVVNYTSSSAAVVSNGIVAPPEVTDSTGDVLNNSMSNESEAGQEEDVDKNITKCKKEYNLNCSVQHETSL